MIEHTKSNDHQERERARKTSISRFFRKLLDPGTISARLVALLPRRDRSNLPSRETLLSVGAAANPRAFIPVIFIYVIVAIFMMGAQWIAASRQPPAPVDSAPVLAAGTVLPQMPKLSSGK